MGNKFIFNNKLKRGDACPECGSENQHTVDSRIIKGQRVRRRMCEDCGCRWNTIEIFYNYVEGVKK